MSYQFGNIHWELDAGLILCLFLVYGCNKWPTTGPNTLKCRLSNCQPVWKGDRGRSLGKCCVIFYDATVLFLLSFQDPGASYDFNDNDHDPFPRYDPTNENKWVNVDLPGVGGQGCSTLSAFIWALAVHAHYPYHNIVLLLKQKPKLLFWLIEPYSN